MTTIDQTTINTIRTLSMDAIQKANSGHPGAPMALAPVAYQLWANHLQYDPANPNWPNRDRYVLSCGHASMLLYSLIHLAGVKQLDESGEATGSPAISLDDIKQFRQWGSLTPGHPEYRHTSGVETTTGPLGQGCANGVGMAFAQRWLAGYFNQPGFELFDFHVYVQCSDGDLMEGISYEAASIAGHHKLSNLCWIYDDNRITIEGSTDLAFTEDITKRFQAMGWNVVNIGDANNLEQLSKAYTTAKENTKAPTLIIVRSTIADGSPNKQGTAGSHGAPLGEEEIRLTKQAYGWPEDKTFYVPQEVTDHFDNTLGKRGDKARQEWRALFERYQNEHPQLAQELTSLLAGELPSAWDSAVPSFETSVKGDATRNSSGKVLNAIASNFPWLIGGSADLAPSNKTNLTFESAGEFSAAEPAGRNMHFGIREHAMASLANGMALCGLRPYIGTFFVFADYLRPALRLAALMQLPVTYVLTHDSIGVGEDGPTHQPVEHLAACRSIPNVVILRPADANETAEAWRFATCEKLRPVVLVLTRQNVPTVCRDTFASASNVAKGGYILADCKCGNPEIILLASGSEVSLAIEAFEHLQAASIPARIVSMPSFELFEEQSKDYQDAVLPRSVKARIAVEAGIAQGWWKYIGSEGAFIGMDNFGASAPSEEIYKQRGITSEAVIKKAKELLAVAVG